MKATLRDFFQRYQISVEQYGETLVAELLNGVKMGNVQPAYDVSTTLERMEQGDCPIRDKITPENGEVRVEVKSKLAEAPSGSAEVVHVSETKLRGKRRGNKTIPPMTHLIVVLVNPDGETRGNVDAAWLLEVGSVPPLLRGKKLGHISVADLRKRGKADNGNIWEISEHFSEVLSRPLF